MSILKFNKILAFYDILSSDMRADDYSKKLN